MKHKNVEVGQHVIIKRSTSDTWRKAADHIGEEFRVVAVEPLDYRDGDTAGCATVRVESVIREVPLRAEFWCNHRDLKLVKEEAPKPAERPFKVGNKAPEIGALFVVTDCTSRHHCFDVGTAVRCAEPPMGAGGNCRYEDKDSTRQFISPSDLKPLSLADIQAALDK